MNARLVGRKSLTEKMRRIDNPKGGHDVKVGIVESARYPVLTLNHRPDRKNPPFVAQVAHWQEFGTKGGGWGGPIPERPFMRNAVRRYLDSEAISLLLRKLIDPRNPALSLRAAQALGNIMQGIMQDGMKDPTFPPNAPVTVAIKTKGEGGKTTPLKDTGLLTQSISHQVIPS